jgi:K+-transporting ATPase ATPase C chain
MLSHLRANLWLLVLSLLLCCLVYPALLWGIGQTAFRDKATGSLILDKMGKPIGSRLIAQPFTADEYFQPRPSAASYNPAASGASNWAASNYQLRDRVARQLGPIVKYRSGPKKDQLVGPDIEAWFQKDEFEGKAGIVGQWAQAHSAVAQGWAKADKLNSDYVAAWQTGHPDEAAQWVKENPGMPAPKPEDLAVPFFVSYSKANPGTFPSAVEQKTPDGKVAKKIEPVSAGGDIQAFFFDMWLQEHSTAQLHEVPADMVMASGSGLDPHITLKNARYQLDRVAGAWASKTQFNKSKVAKEVEALLEKEAEAPLGGLVGVKMVNVLEVNLKLGELFSSRLAKSDK